MMTKGLAKALFFLIPLLLPLSNTRGATMTDYCQTPPSAPVAVSPNILFVVDVSGSMGWEAYSYNDTDSNRDGILDGYDPSISYEGYFTPTKTYKKDTNGIYQEVIKTGTPCTTTCLRWRCRSSDRGGCIRRAQGCPQSRRGGEWACCEQQGTTGDCGTTADLGSYLNYANTSRIDLLRWAITGGMPDSCTGRNAFDAAYCDPEVWNEAGNATKVGADCNNSLDVNGDGIAEGGCILRTSSGVRVKVPWSRINDSLANQFKQLGEAGPRIGALFYSGTSMRDEKVYLGDFTDSGTRNGLFPYMNFITDINSSEPSGGTPTGPAVWEALNYFSQKSPEYGGFSVQSGTTGMWRNPMYVCDSSGSNCGFVPCIKNFVLLMSDGQWNEGGGPPAGSACTIDTGYEMHSADPVVPSYKMHKGFQNVASSRDTDVNAIYTLGLFLGGTGEQSMMNVAMYGSFDKTTRTWPGSLTGYPSDKCNMDDCSGTGKGSGCAALPPSSTDWDWDGNNVPDTFFKAENALMIKGSIMDAVLDALRRTASGSAASVLASGQGSGANLVQGIFYPKRRFQNGVISWTGSLQNIWYYVDPFLLNSTLREDSTADEILDLSNDNIIKPRYDNVLQTTVVDVCSDPACTTITQTKSLEGISTLWGAGLLLWKRDPATRTIYTTTDGVSLTSFTTGNAALVSLLQAPNQNAADRIVSYTRGTDYANKFCSSTVATTCTQSSNCPTGETCIGYRSRTASIELNNNGILDPGETNVWKLGDIVDSTSQTASWIPLKTYHKVYKDSTYGPSGQDPKLGDPADATHFITTTAYKGRGMVFAGANDGMLHAFKLGTMQPAWSGQGSNQKARLINPDTGKVCSSTDANPCGNEMWAFIPKNVLPYLKYLADPNYCHIFTTDLTPYVFDASINGKSTDKKTSSSWRTVLIGGMRLGGACRNLSSPACTDCVKTPIKDVGYSSYFALDITDNLGDPTKPPVLLWEFSSDQLGFSTSGPAVVRIGADGTKNGSWYAVLGSGPTGPMDTTNGQFLGRSDQNLRFFILDLKTGSLAKTVDSGIQTAFAGSMLNATNDTNANYQDDVLYIPYVKKAADGTWTAGGVGRLLTKESDPAAWTWSTVIDNIGPVTAAVDRLQDPAGRLWLYFGSGRNYYKTPSAIDDQAGKRILYGVKDPCYKPGSVSPLADASGFISGCSVKALTDVTSSGSVDPATVDKTDGWYITLDSNGDFAYPEGNPAQSVTRNYGAERLITDPLATLGGVVFFTTYKPYTDSCSTGGKTFLWAVRYENGGTGGSRLNGKALMQVSTGNIEQINLSDAFKSSAANPDSKNDRRSAAIEGVPPTAQGLSVISPPQPVKRVIHVKEK